MNQQKLFLWVKILAVIGVGLAIYLLAEQWFQPAYQPCRINATVNCDAVISGAVSKTLGIPTPLYGLVGYIVIFFAAMFGRKKLLLGMATFGLLFCLWIGYRELFQLHVVCPVCIGCQLVIITVFILSIIVNRNRQAISI